jgi:hypothetical protein
MHEIIRSWRKLHNEELRNLFSSRNIFLNDQVKEYEMAKDRRCLGERRNSYRVSVEKLEGKRPLGRPRIRWKYNIKMGLWEVGWAMDWIYLTLDRDQLRTFVNTVMNCRLP